MAERGAADAGRPAVPLIFAITVTGIMGNTLVSPALPDILRGLDAPAGAAGWIIGATTLPGVVLAPVIGLLADRYGRRPVLVPCLVLFGVAGGLSAAAPSIEWMVLLRFLQGAGSAGLINLAVVLIGDHWQGTERSRLIGRNAAVLTVCLTVFPLLGGTLSDVGGWQWAFAPFPLAVVTATVLWNRLPREEPSRDAPLLGQLAKVGPALRSPQVLGVLGGASLTFALIFGLLLTVLPVYLEEAFGLAGSGRGLILGVPALTNTVAALSLGRLRARFSYQRIVLAGSALLTVGLVGVAGSSSLLALVAGVMVFGAGEGFVVPTLQDLATSVGTRETRGTLVAVFVSAARLGQTTGPVAASALAARAAAGPPAAFMGGAVVAVLVGVLVTTTARRQPAPR